MYQLTNKNPLVGVGANKEKGLGLTKMEFFRKLFEDEALAQLRELKLQEYAEAQVWRNANMQKR